MSDMRTVRVMVVGQFNGVLRKSGDYAWRLPKGTGIRLPNCPDYSKAAKILENDEYVDMVLFTEDDERSFQELVNLYGPFVPRLRFHPNRPWAMTMSPEYDVLMSPFRLNGIRVCSGFLDAVLERLELKKRVLN
jgi:hypothetical protein